MLPDPAGIDFDCVGVLHVNPCGVILCHLPEKERKEIEEIIEEMKEREGKKQE